MPANEIAANGKARLWGGRFDTNTMRQIENLASLPFIDGHVAVMPDAHYGMGSTVGSVIPTVRAVIPATVGVDIGCGMVAVETSLTASRLPDSLRRLRADIEAAVPVGFASRSDDSLMSRKEGRELARDAFDSDFEHLLPKRWARQMGTLGGGNHFIEVCLDERDHVWAMLHSGSRGAGNAIGRHWIVIAKREAEKRGERLPDSDLAYLQQDTPSFDAYVHALRWAQRYAAANRDAMMELVLDAMRREFGTFGVDGMAVNCHHNYVEALDCDGEPVSDFKRRRPAKWITRKGAISARKGQLGIVPGSMGTKSYIVRGLGNPESHHSSSHGAGRRMSRKAAKARFTPSDFAKQTAGVECRKGRRFIDEIPGAYKDIDEVMAAQDDLTEPVHELRAVLCVKG